MDHEQKAKTRPTWDVVANVANDFAETERADRARMRNKALGWVAKQINCPEITADLAMRAAELRLKSAQESSERIGQESPPSGSDPEQGPSKHRRNDGYRSCNTGEHW